MQERKSTVLVKTTAEIKAALRAACAEDGRTMSTFIHRLLERELLAPELPEAGTGTAPLPAGHEAGPNATDGQRME